jgi:hypothetical protein
LPEAETKIKGLLNKNKIVCGIAVFAAVGLALLLPDLIAKGKSQSSGSSKHEDSNSDSDKKKHDDTKSKQNAGEGANRAAALQINSKEGTDKVVASLKTLNAKDYRVEIYENGKIVKTYGALPLSDVQMISKKANISNASGVMMGPDQHGRRWRTRFMVISTVVTTRAQATLQKMQTALEDVDKKTYELKTVEMPEKKN